MYVSDSDIFRMNPVPFDIVPLSVALPPMPLVPATDQLPLVDPGKINKQIAIENTRVILFKLYFIVIFPLSNVHLI